jgi:hypothetical protein
MIRVQATSPDQTIAVLKKLQSWQPFRFSNIKYIRKIDNDTFGCYERQPKINKDPLYKIVITQEPK